MDTELETEADKVLTTGGKREMSYCTATVTERKQQQTGVDSSSVDIIKKNSTERKNAAIP